MSAKEDLLAAIRDYAAAARHIPSAQRIIEQANALADEVSNVPDPVSQGEGSVPAQGNGSSGQREQGGTPTVQIVIGQGQAPRFPDKAGVVARLKGQ